MRQLRTPLFLVRSLGESLFSVFSNKHHDLRLNILTPSSCVQFPDRGLVIELYLVEARLSPQTVNQVRFI